MTRTRKTELRITLREQRQALSSAAQATHAQAIAQVLDQHIPASLTTVGAYLAIDGELDPTPALQQLRERHIRTLLPRLGPHGSSRMEFALTDEQTVIVKSRHGTRQPADDAPASTPSVLLMPCVGIDARGARLGFGGGFYDRYCQRYPSSLRIGLAHDCQLIRRIDSDAWDAPLDAALTESGFRWFGSRARALFG